MPYIAFSPVATHWSTNALDCAIRALAPGASLATSSGFLATSTTCSRLRLFPSIRIVCLFIFLVTFIPQLTVFVRRQSNSENVTLSSHLCNLRPRRADTTRVKVLTHKRVFSFSGKQSKIVLMLEMNDR